ncbi:MAG: Lrp/AsnC family transcriptional regulator [Candidatus Woesearchaeota archaeon]|nr:Lrp/AsnC family transcriptional regulator [Candidatus Woesearchaeota archaeon]
MVEIKLDLKDKKIIAELSLNARENISDVAKKVGLSKQVVKYRLENLEKRGIIEGYYAILNINKLGYLYYRFFVKFQNVNPEKENEIIEFCRKHKKIGRVFQLDGDWDFAVAVWAKDIIEFEEVIDEILDKFGKYFEEKLISVATRIHHLKYKFLLNKEDSTEFVLGGKVEETKLDEIDYNIIGILTKDARKSLLEIGEELKLHPKVVKYRINALLKKKIILGFNVKLNHRLLGYDHHKVFLNLTNISKESILKLITYLKSLTNSIYITKAVGIAELEFEVMVRSNEEFHDIMRELRYKFSDLIKNYSSFIIYYEPYINYLPLKK